LDLEEKDLPGVVYRVVEQMVVEELINQEDKAAVMRLMLLRHKHVQQDSDKFSRFIRRNTSSYTSLTVPNLLFLTLVYFYMASKHYLLSFSLKNKIIKIFTSKINVFEKTFINMKRFSELCIGAILVSILKATFI